MSEMKAINYNNIPFPSVADYIKTGQFEKDLEKSRNNNNHYLIFRGQDVESGDWIQGCGAWQDADDYGVYIIDRFQGFRRVRRQTAEHCVGFKDGKEIWAPVGRVD